MHVEDDVAATGAQAEAGAAAEIGKEHRADAWTIEHWRTFFDLLAMTGDVATAAAAIGETAQAAFSMRRRSARFAGMWRTALDVGYDRLEVAVLRQVLGETGTALDVGAAMLLLDRRRGAGGEGAAARKRKAVDGAAARAAAERELVRRVQAFAKRAATATTA